MASHMPEDGSPSCSKLAGRVEQKDAHAQLDSQGATTCENRLLTHAALSCSQARKRRRKKKEERRKKKEENKRAVAGARALHAPGVPARHEAAAVPKTARGLARARSWPWPAMASENNRKGEIARSDDSRALQSTRPRPACQACQSARRRARMQRRRLLEHPRARQGVFPPSSELVTHPPPILRRPQRPRALVPKSTSPLLASLSPPPRSSLG